MTRWFIFPLSNEANSLLHLNLPEVNFHEEFTCNDKSRPLWECDYEFVQRLIRDLKSNKISFAIYKSESKNKPPILWEKYLISNSRKKKLKKIEKPAKTLSVPSPQVKDEQSPFD